MSIRAEFVKWIKTYLYSGIKKWNRSLLPIWKAVQVTVSFKSRCRRVWTHVCKHIFCVYMYIYFVYKCVYNTLLYMHKYFLETFTKTCVLENKLYIWFCILLVHFYVLLLVGLHYVTKCKNILSFIIDHLEMN